MVLALFIQFESTCLDTNVGNIKAEIVAITTLAPLLNTRSGPAASVPKTKTNIGWSSSSNTHWGRWSCMHEPPQPRSCHHTSAFILLPPSPLAPFLFMLKHWHIPSNGDTNLCFARVVLWIWLTKDPWISNWSNKYFILCPLFAIMKRSYFKWMSWLHCLWFSHEYCSFDVSHIRPNTV